MPLAGRHPRRDPPGLEELGKRELVKAARVVAAGSHRLCVQTDTQDDLVNGLIKSTQDAMRLFCLLRDGWLGGELIHQCWVFGLLMMPALKWSLRLLGPHARLYG